MEGKPLEYEKEKVQGVEITFSRSANGTYSWEDGVGGLSGHNFLTYVMAVADAKKKLFQDLHGRD